MECVPLVHLLSDGSNRRSTGCSFQQPEHFSLQVSAEISTQKKPSVQVFLNVNNLQICDINFAIDVRILEAVLIIMVTTASIFIAAMFLGTCVRKDTLMDPSSRYALNYVSESKL